MADPVIKKISLLPEATSIAAGDLFAIVDLDEPVAAKRTKKAPASLVTLYNSAQITDGIVVESKLATDAVTTSKIKAGNVTTDRIASKAITAAQIADDTITAAQIATGGVGSDEIAAGAVTQVKLSGVVRTVAIPVYGDDDGVIVKNHTRRFTWPNALNGHLITRVSAVISGVASSSGSITIQVNNAGGTVATVSIGSGLYSAETTSINSSYRTATSMAPVGINVTAEGTGAKGLSVYLEMLG